MGYNGAGVYTLPPGSIISDGTSADAADLNTPLEDLEDALNLVHISDGRKAAEANWPMGGFKLTGMADGSAATDSATIKQAQVGVLSQATTVGGTADAITLSFTPAIAAYTTGMKLRWTSGGACTVTNPTVNVHSIGAKTIKKGASAALAIGDTGASGYQCEAVYDGTDFILLNPASGASAASTSQAGVSELATTAETLTGTDAARTVTPDGLAGLWEAGSDVTDGAAITIGEGGYFNLITSTTAITSFSVTTDKAGRSWRCRFDTARTLTYNATSLILPGLANITTAQGDVAQFRSLGSGNVICEWYTRASVAPPGGASWAYHSTHTPGAVSTYEVTGLSGNKHLRLRWYGLRFTASRTIALRFSTDNGSNYISTSTYTNDGAAATSANIHTINSAEDQGLYGESVLTFFGENKAMFQKNSVYRGDGVNAASVIDINSQTGTTARNALQVLSTTAGTFGGGYFIIETSNP